MRLIYGRQDRAAERRATLARERYPSIDCTSSIDVVISCSGMLPLEWRPWWANSWLGLDLPRASRAHHCPHDEGGL
jgi:hypothetical protein